MNALLKAINQEMAHRAAAGLRGSRIGNALTAAITGPVSEVSRLRGKGAVGALVGEAR